MPYVTRKSGKIDQAFEQVQSDMPVEFISSDDPELAAFLALPIRPVSVSARQFKLQLFYAGLKSAVDAWVAQQSQDVQIAYEYSGEFVKDSPVMQAGFAAMGFTPAQVDQFFEDASKL